MQVDNKSRKHFRKIKQIKVNVKNNNTKYLFVQGQKITQKNLRHTLENNISTKLYYFS